jgi:hypothetical protein
LSTREQDVEAVGRFREHLEPGGTLLLDIEVPYADAKEWRYWLLQERAKLPEAPKAPRERRQASDGAAYALRSRIVELDPLEQCLTLEMHAELWRDGALEADEDRTLTMNLYFKNELLLMLEQAGFVDVVVQGDHNAAKATSDDRFLVFVAKTD